MTDVEQEGAMNEIAALEIVLKMAIAHRPHSAEQTKALERVWKLHGTLRNREFNRKHRSALNDLGSMFADE